MSEPTTPVFIDGFEVDRAEWESLNGAEKVWIIATCAVARDLPADFLTGPHDPLTAWVAEHIGFSEHSGKAFAFMFGLSLQIGAIRSGARVAWTPGARLPSIPPPPPTSERTGGAALAGMIVDALRAGCEEPEEPTSRGMHRRRTRKG